MRPSPGLTVAAVCRACGVLLLVCLVCFTIAASPVDRRRDRQVTNKRWSKHRQAKVRKQGRGGEPADQGETASPPGQAEIVRLLDAFGLKTVPRPNRTAVTSPPAYMVSLYHQLESSAGTGTNHRSPDAPTIPRANTVRSFNEKGTMASRNKFLFDTSSVLSRETVMAAELHLYKQKARPTNGWVDTQSHTVVLELYELRQRVNTLLEHSLSSSRTLMDRKVMNASHRGWVRFNVTGAFKKGVAESGHLGSDKLFEIRIKSDRDLPKGTVTFSKRPRPKHKDHRPLLVLFLDDRNVVASDITLPGTEPHPARDTAASGPRGRESSDHEDEVEEDTLGAALERSDRRKRRASSRTGNRGKDKCKLYDYYVDFNVIGWSNWVIAPNGYTANFCEGDCPFPLDINFNATNHATVQAILHMHTGTYRNNNRRLPNPCCVPATLESIHVLYLDDLNNVVLKEFSDMIATSCGCQ